MLNKRALSILPHFLRKFLGLNNPLKLKIDNREIIIPIDVQGSFPNLFLNKTWKTNIISHFTSLSDGVFVDVGANLGQTLIEFWIANISEKNTEKHSNAATSALYVGFEPNQNCVQYLKSVIDMNTLKGYQILPIGLFNEYKLLSLYTQSDRDACGTVVENLRPSRKYDSNSVVCQKFDDVFPELEIGNISLIKIDVEGSELEVLQGMDSTIKKLRPPILCEVLFTDRKADLSFMESRNKLLVSLLDEWNYSIFQVVKSKNGSDVKKYVKISSFTSDFWSLRNMDLCDYLFIPIEHEEEWINSVYS